MAENHQASLGENRFEELEVMKFAWRTKIPNFAASNSAQVEEVDLDENTDSIDEFMEMLCVDESAAEFDKLEDEFIFVD